MADTKTNGSFKYTVDGTFVPSGQKFDITLEISGFQRKFDVYMQEAADKDKKFQFTAKYFQNMGFYVTTINDLQEDPDNKLAWAFLRETGGGLSPVDVVLRAQWISAWTAGQTVMPPPAKKPPFPNQFGYLPGFS